MAKVSDRVAIVTGGGTGIGAATAHALATNGVRVIVTGRRAGPLEDVADGIGGVAMVADVTSEDDWGRVVAVA
ncbi:MAG TPA: SDR family NAD(P)-dependent oxidoreductase, partial [Acidimicrobiia bacterium]|nr:SDR family NAD(P)-dependent oxidoreductase [Acidimicrobiia bacterium]